MIFFNKLISKHRKVIKHILTIMAVLCFTFTTKPQNIPQSEKIRSLSLYWKEVSYNFINFNDEITPQAWDSIYTMNLIRILETDDDTEYFKIMKNFAAFLKDQHTGIYMYEDRSNNDYLPVGQMLVKDKVFITVTTKKYNKRLPLGSQVLEVDGENVFNYIEKRFSSTIFASTPQSLRSQAVDRMFSGKSNLPMQLKVVTPNKDTNIVDMIMNSKSHKYTYIESPVYNDVIDVPFSIKEIDKYTSYLKIPSFSIKDKIFIDFLYKNEAVLKKCKNLIIDLRDNEGGNGELALKLAGMLVSVDTFKNCDWETRENIGAYRAWGSNNYIPRYTKYYDGTAIKKYSGEYYKNDMFFIKPQLVILVNAKTCSSSENFIMDLKINGKDFIMFGETTAGSTGTPLIVEFLNGWGRLCAKTNYDGEGKRFVRRGLKPDIEVYLSEENIIKGGDAVLDSALQYLK